MIDEESGEKYNDHYWFEWVKPPSMEGFVVPPWVLNAKIHWNMYYDNYPDLYLATPDDVFDFDEEIGYEFRPPSLYIAESGDGRATAKFHDALRLQTLRRFKGWDPVKREQIFVNEELWATPPSRGFAGREFSIKMKDGKTGLLRGPWYGGAPDGYQEVTVKFRKDWDRKGEDRPWWRVMGIFGLGVSTDLYMQLCTHFCGVTKFARCGYNHISHEAPVVPVHPEWAVPKGWIPRSQRDRFERWERETW